VTTYSQEELDRAVAAATAEIDAKVKALEAAAATSEVETKVAEAVAAKDGELAELQTKLDAATLEAQTEKVKREKIEAWLQGEEEAATAKREADSRKDARLAEVKEMEIAFTEEWLAEHADRLAAMSDEDWAARKAEWAEIASKAKGNGAGGGNGSAGGSGTLSGARETDALRTRQGQNGSSPADVMGTIRELAGVGVDPRTLPR